jgi:uncharacterized protein
MMVTNSLVQVLFQNKNICMKRKILILFFLLAVRTVTMASVWTVESVPNTRTQDSRVFTSDPDDLIDAGNQSSIDSLLNDVEKQFTAEVFVVALQSIGQTDIKSFATELFNKWGIGKASKDNGLLILLVMDQKKITMETGYGMEGVLPDAICFRIIDNVMVPYMREGQVGTGLFKGVESVTRILSDPAAAAEIRVDEQALMKAKMDEIWSTVRLILGVYAFLTIVVLILSSVQLRKKFLSVNGLNSYDSYKTLHTSATGYKTLAVFFPLTMLPFLLYFNARLKTLRVKPRLCPKCGKDLKRMSEKQEDAYLTPGQQNEEMLGSVDYDVWVCMDCGNRIFLPYDKSFTRYQPCPKCHYKTYAQITDRIVMPPTPLSAGQGAHVYSCGNCGYESVKYFVIPMIVVLPSGRGGNGGGFGGGFGGGSFGGGSSGGGGATGGW